jgi:arogenate dehydrogenase (NADP+)
VLKLIETTNADSFDLFYGLFKFNRNSMDIIVKLRDAMDDVVGKLLEEEGKSDDDAESRKACI